MIKISVFLLFLLSCYACTPRNEQEQRKDSHSEFRVQTFKVKGGWGYAVFINNKEYIRQRFTPALEGEVPFTTAQQALEVGNYVVYKLKSTGNPTLSRKELKQLHIVLAESQY